MADRTDRTYRLEPPDIAGVFLGLGLVQCCLLGSGILAAVSALSAGAPLPVAGLAVGLTGFTALGRLGGRPAWEWIPLLSAWSWTTACRRRRWSPPLPLWPTAQPTPLPPCLSGLHIVEVEWRTGFTIAAVEDTQRRTLTAVVPVSGPQFVVEARSEQERLLAGWGDVMAQFSVERGPVTHLTWSELARPVPIGGRAAEEQVPGLVHQDAASSYAALVNGRSDAATAHEVLLTVTVARDRLARHSGGGSVEDRLRRALTGSVEALIRGLRNAGLTADDPLDCKALQRTVRTRIAPHSVWAPQVSGRLSDRLAQVAGPTTGPLAVSTEWDHLHVDETWHRTWWIGTWPRLTVPPSWLEPFLSASGLTRAMTVILAPLPTHSSRRRIERGLVALDSDATTKEGAGRRVDARHRRATQALLEREEELIAGYPEVAYCGLVTASAPTHDQLDEQGEILEQLARENGMDLRVLHARQDTAWSATLPLGLAPSTLLAR